MTFYELKKVATTAVIKELNSHMWGWWNNLQFEHADKSGFWFTYTLKGSEARQTLVVRLPTVYSRAGLQFPLYRDLENENIYTIDDMYCMYQSSESEIPTFYQWLLEVCGKNGSIEELN